MKNFALRLWGISVLLILLGKTLWNDGLDLGLAIYERSKARKKEDLRTVEQKSRFIRHYGLKWFEILPYTSRPFETYTFYPFGIHRTKCNTK